MRKRHEIPPRARRAPGAAPRPPKALLAALLLVLACGRADRVEVQPPQFLGAAARLEIRMGRAIAPGTLRVWLDGTAVQEAFAPVATGRVVAELPLDPGLHVVRAEALAGDGPRSDEIAFDAPEPLPVLLASEPAAGATDVPTSAWPELTFASRPADAALDHLGLHCAEEDLAFRFTELPGNRVVVNPDPALPAGAACRLSWFGPAGPEAIDFRTAPAGVPAEVRYDRSQTADFAPFPDDVFLTADPTAPTGERVALPLPARPPAIQGLYQALLHDANRLDGWSPLAPLVVELSEPVDPASVPRTPAESLDPLASVALFDIREGSESYGERIPFRLDPRNDTTPAGDSSSVLLLWPSRPLDSGGRYALVVTRRALAPGARAFGPSPFFAAALGEEQPGEAPVLQRVRGLLDPVLDVLEYHAVPRIPPEDLALAVRISVRSTDDIPLDLLAAKQEVLAAPPPAIADLHVEYETDPASPLAAVVRGTWQAPDWRPPGGANVARGPDGRPHIQSSRPVPFVLALPRAAEQGPVPVVLHQHGNPGSQEEVVSNARRFLAPAGFAVIGFTDILNREVAEPTNPDGSPRSDEERIELQVLSIFFDLLLNRTLPDHWFETTAEQLAFLRVLQGGALAGLDVLPAGGDGVPELDLSAPLAYHGISEGGNNGQALVPYAPELKTAALVVGGARLAEVLVHQQAQVFLELVPNFFSGITPVEIWTGVSLFQMIFDVQDRQNHLAFAYRDPVEVEGTRRKPSVLLIEGLDDSLVPNHATESAAWVLGLPQLSPQLRPVPFLDAVSGPVQGNLGDDTTGALSQYAPVGLPDLPPTPGCEALSERSATEGHYCAQGAAESQLQRVIFFRSALEGVPEIADTLQGGGVLP